MLRYLLEKEFKQILRNKFLKKMLVAFPLMMIVVFPYVTSQEVTDVKVCIVDNDRSQASARLAMKVAASRCFALAGSEPTYSRALESVERGRADIVMEIPQGFARDAAKGMEPRVMVAANSVNGVRGALGAQYLGSIVGALAAEARAESGLAATVGAAAEPSPLHRYNPTLDYRVFMVPGLIAVLITLLCCALTALNIVGEKEAGTIEQINVSPVPRRLFILAKLMPNWAIGLVALAFGMAFAWAVHGITPAAGVATVLLPAALFILAASAMGMVISNYSDTMQQAMFVMFFFIIIMMLTCGLFTPVESMPQWAQAATSINPMTYFARAMRMAYLKGSSPADMAPCLAALAAFAVAFNAWAVLSYRKNS